MDIDPETVLNFWFGDQPGSLDEGKRRRQRWFQADPEFDAEIQRRFGSAVIAAGRGELRDWTATARGALAVILLLDQFPRNIFRGTAKAFSFDAAALACCRDGIACGSDLRLSTVERAFFYLPLEHAEDLKTQNMSIAQYQKLLVSAAGGSTEFAQTSLDYASDHLALIEQFGRFPHRNAVLGRTSSADELAFLTSQGKSFGQG